MAHDKAHDPSHPEQADAGAKGGKPESAENSAEAVGDQQKKTKGKVRSVVGRVWDAFKDGVKKGIRDAGYVTGVLEHPKDRGEEEAPKAEEKHDKAHEPEAKEAKEPKKAEEPATTSEATAGTDNDEGAPAVPEGEEAPIPELDSNGADESASKPAPAPAPAPVVTLKPAEKPEEKPAHDKKHDAHPKEEGMSTGTKVALGVAGTTVALGALATAGAVAVASEITQTTIEHGPKWFQTAGNFVKWPFRATGKFLGHLSGTPVVELKDGFEYGAEEFVGEADYEELEGWTAPWKAVKNVGRSLVRNPITRTIAGAGFGALGFLGGIFKGGVEGGVDAFSEENKPTWEMPWKRTRKAKPKKEKKPKKAKADAHGHGADHGHGKDTHATPEAGHGDAHGHGSDHKDAHKDDHAKPAHATEPAHAEPPAHHRLAA